MVQVRCPECGYLQTLSEERFLSISDDFLNCPHCHARVPKQWAPSSESIPEDARHKMLAFSRRILNGGDVIREVVYALESLVRHHGPLEESNKALGIGYAALGERKKAEEFLLAAHGEAPEDLEVLRSLLRLLVAERKFEEAVQVGSSLVSLGGDGAYDEDVAGLALALLRTEKIEEAKEILDAHPTINARNSLVKQAKRELNRRTGKGLSALFRDRAALYRWFGGRRKQESSAVPVATEEAVQAAPQDFAGRERNQAASVEHPGSCLTDLSVSVLDPTLEYWIYAPEAVVPGWEQVRERLSEQIHEESPRTRFFKTLESYIASEQLTIAYIRREQAEDLFVYPEDFIPQNARELSVNDYKALIQARMIVRVKLTETASRAVEGLFFVVRFVEALRGLTIGVVQDAISHTLWGTARWSACAEQPGRSFIESHLQLEALDEGETVWIHTHGMQKFGLSDIELEGIPAELVGAGRRLLILVAETLVAARQAGEDLVSVMEVEDTPFLFTATPRPKDAEGHFPAGSLAIVPSLRSDDPGNLSDLRHVLMEMQTFSRNRSRAEMSDAPAEQPSPKGEPAPQDYRHVLREQLLAAHRMATQHLPDFKKSFRGKQNSEEDVHAVKVGFPVENGVYEWMWISLDAWRGRSIVGYLENTPQLRKDLQQGMRVEISEAEVFDWVIAHEGQIVEGAYTESVLNP